MLKQPGEEMHTFQDKFLNKIEAQNLTTDFDKEPAKQKQLRLQL